MTNRRARDRSQTRAAVLADNEARQTLVVCEYCDAVCKHQTLRPNEKAVCGRCGEELYRDNRRAYRRLLPLTITAVILFIISNAFPIVEMDLQGSRTQAKLWTAIVALNHDGMESVSALVFATTLFFPACELLVMTYVLFSMVNGRRAPFFNQAMRLLLASRPWGMLEVFLVGVLVAAVKLGTIASVAPSVGLWSYGALVLVMASILSFDVRHLWILAGDET